MLIFLVGFMGSGKTFIGPHLAKRLGFDFIDLDDEIEEKAGMPISALFREHGEASFRHLETACLQSLLRREWAVVSTGGGTPCFHDNMDWMNEHGITVYLCSQPKQLVERLLPEKSKRPLLAGVPDEELEAFITSKLMERTIFYEKSHLEFDASANGTEGVEVLAKYLQRFFKKN